MPKKDEIASWFIQNVLMVDREDFTNEGYIVEKVRDKSRKYQIRDVALPEDLLVNIEKKFASLNPKAKNRMYSVGKRFGFRYSQSLGIPKYDKSQSFITEKQFKATLYFMIRYIESVSAANIQYETDLDKKLLKLNMEDFIVCRKNGMGFILTSGVAAGLWSFGMDDITIEGVQTKCEGRGDDNCEVICAPREVLKKEGLDFNKTDIAEQNLKISRDYKQVNKVRAANYAENSLRDLLDVGFFNYAGGKMSYGNDRYVLAEASLVYLLEKKLSDLPEGEKILFQTAFSYADKLARKEKDDKKMEKFIREYLSACGWGDTLIKEKKNEFQIITRLFPWTKFWKETSFPIYRGLVSGFLSGFSGRKIKLNKIEKDTKVDGFTVISSEN